MIDYPHIESNDVSTSIRLTGVQNVFVVLEADRLYVLLLYACIVEVCSTIPETRQPYS